MRISIHECTGREVACPCRFNLPLGPLLPGCVRVRTARTFWLTEGRSVMYAQKQGKRGFLISVTTVLPASGRVGHLLRPFLGPVGRSLCPSRVPKRSKWQDRRIIRARLYGRLSCIFLIDQMSQKN